MSKPTHRLKVLNKRTNTKSELGAGWLNDNGSITLVLNECVVIQHNSELVYTIFPVTKKDET